MRIGILTFHRAHNYGAVLQCYALQQILVRRGHDVRIIDYRQPWIEDQYKLFSLNMMRRNAGSISELAAYLSKTLKKFLISPLRGLYFRRFREEYLATTAPCKEQIPQDFDCYVVGSDQLWSLHCLGGKCDPVYMGRFDRPSGSRLVGYAISADIRSIETLAAEIKQAAGLYDSLSMREEKVAAMVASISGKECPVCVDPTLLTDAELWEPLVDERWKDRNYVLVYEVRWNRQTRGRLRAKAEKLAAKIGDGCKVIDVSGMRCSVRDFVSLFRYARHVVTTSFHGIVLSIIFNTPFHALPLWDSYDLRYRELLGRVGAEDRLVGWDDDIEPGQMDFGEINRRLVERRKDSIDYIEKNIG